MPRNSRDNSLSKFQEIKGMAKTYSLRDKYLSPTAVITTKYARNVLSQIIHINKVMDVLCEPYRTIISKTFFEAETSNRCWWVGCYSKTTFYRLRSKAINSFLLAYQTKWNID